jgi:hypothetical protein
MTLPQGRSARERVRKRKRRKRLRISAADSSR